MNTCLLIRFIKFQQDTARLASAMSCAFSLASFTNPWRCLNQDILLNVFLAIAVDNLGDDDEDDEEEKEKEAAEQGSANVDVQVRRAFRDKIKYCDELAMDLSYAIHDWRLHGARNEIYNFSMRLTET